MSQVQATVTKGKSSRKGNKAAAPAAPAVQEQAQATQEPAAPAPIEQAAPAPIESPAVKFHLAFGRPVAGVHLVAHTAAFMELTGMSATKAVPGALVRKVMGQSAVAYHTARGNFEDTEAGLKLTSTGAAHFALRSVSKELKAGFVAVLSKGETNEAAGVKNPAAVKPV
jgi:hypothetical protein